MNNTVTAKELRDRLKTMPDNTLVQVDLERLNGIVRLDITHVDCWNFSDNKLIGLRVKE